MCDILFAVNTVSVDTNSNFRAVSYGPQLFNASIFADKSDCTQEISRGSVADLRQIHDESYVESD